MTPNIWMAIHPRPQSTRVLATSGAKQTLLKAHLATSPAHPRAVPALLEAIALWQGQVVHAALVADDRATGYDTSLYRDAFAVANGGPLYQLAFVDGSRPRKRRDRLEGLGDFRDLRQLLLWEVAR